MSLDVYLYGPERNVECDCPTCGHGHTTSVRDCLFSRNITHNLGRMASEAGVYYALWHPADILDPGSNDRIRELRRQKRYDEEAVARSSLPVVHASDLVGPLRQGLSLLTSDPARFQLLNPGNGWGDYGGLLEFVREYLAACERFPESTVEAHG